MKTKKIKKLTKTQKALQLLEKADQLTIALKQLRRIHEEAMGGKLCLTRFEIIEDIDKTLELIKA